MTNQNVLKNIEDVVSLIRGVYFFDNSDELFEWLYLDEDMNTFKEYLDISMEDLMDSPAENVLEYILLKDDRCYRIEDGTWILYAEQ